MRWRPASSTPRGPPTGTQSGTRYARQHPCPGRGRPTTSPKRASRSSASRTRRDRCSWSTQASASADERAERSRSDLTGKAALVNSSPSRISAAAASTLAEQGRSIVADSASSVAASTKFSAEVPLRSSTCQAELIARPVSGQSVRRSARGVEGGAQPPPSGCSPTSTVPRSALRRGGPTSRTVQAPPAVHGGSIRSGPTTAHAAPFEHVSYAVVSCGSGQRVERVGQAFGVERGVGHHLSV